MRKPAPAAKPTVAEVHRDPPGREFVQGLQRGLAVFKAFGAGGARLTITEVANRTGLTRAVARRYMSTDSLSRARLRTADGDTTKRLEEVITPELAPAV